MLRKHAQMLANAGVDAVFFDVTNQLPRGNLRVVETGWGHPLSGTKLSSTSVHFLQYWTGVR